MNFRAHPNGFSRTQCPAVSRTLRFADATAVAEHWKSPCRSVAKTLPWTVFGGRSWSGTW